MSAVDIQEKIAAARREAEGLKEKIRAKREQTGDTSRTSTRLSCFISRLQFPSPSLLVRWARAVGFGLA